MNSIILIFTLTLNVVFCRPQFISFNDGKFGVNFGGYHAEAGLGGILTGNAAHGGLSASAGTPYGQKAAAGIGGATGGNSQGGAYASASAGRNVGASAGLGAIAGGDAGLGAEAHAGKVSSSASGSSGTGFQVSRTKTVPTVSKTAVGPPEYGNNVIYRTGGQINGNIQSNNNVVKETVIQRIKPPKKYARVNSHAHVAQPSNTVTIVEKSAIQQPQQVYLTKTVEPVIQTKYVTKTKLIAPAPVVNEPIPLSSPSKTYGYTTKTVTVDALPPVVENNADLTGAFQGNFNSAGFFDSIFNIPIQTLKAVNGLVNNVAGGIQASGNVAVSKSTSTGSY